MKENAALHKQGHEYFLHGNMDSMRTLLADDATFHVPGSNPLAGDYTGRDEVFGFFDKMQKMFEGTYRFEDKAVFGNDDYSVALMETKAKRQGRELSTDGVEIVKWRDGKIAEEWFLPRDYQKWNEFLS